MIYCKLKALNPFWKPNSHFASKDYYYKHVTLTSNKSFEIQISRFDAYHVFDVGLDLRWWGSDHAGPELEISIWGFTFMVKIYDHRHWDIDQHCWCTNENDTN